MHLHLAILLKVPPFLLILFNYANAYALESNRWKPQDIANVTVSTFAILVPLITAIIRYVWMRNERKEQKKRATAIPLNEPPPAPDQPAATQPAATQPAQIAECTITT